MLFFQHRLAYKSFHLSFKIDPVYHISPGVRTKNWLILGVSLTYLVESRYLFFLEAEIVDNIFQWDVLKNMRRIKCYDDMFQVIRA